MKKIKQIFDYILTTDFLTVLIAIMSLSLLTTAFASWLKPEKLNEVSQLFLTYSVLSFVASYLILKPIEYLFLSKLPINLMWLFVIILGSFGFSCFFVEMPFINFSLFFSFLCVALIPAVTFRFAINFIISYWRERKQLPISIIK